MSIDPTDAEAAQFLRLDGIDDLGVWHEGRLLHQHISGHKLGSIAAVPDQHLAVYQLMSEHVAIGEQPPGARGADA